MADEMIINMDDDLYGASPLPMAAAMPEGVSHIDLDVPVVNRIPDINTAAKRQPTKADWEMMKPKIKRLYIDQNLKLSEVQEMIKAEFGFEPTSVSLIRLLS